MASSTSWLSYLNTVQPDGTLGNSESPNGTGFLSEDLRAQLEAWTTVAFEDASFTNNSLHNFGKADFGESPGADPEGKPDPSPYAKRSFAQIGQQPILERGFNAFNPDPAFSNSNIGAATGFANFDLEGLGSNNSSGNNIFSDANNSYANASLALDNAIAQSLTAALPAKKHKSGPSSSDFAPSNSVSASTSPQPEPSAITGGIKASKQTLLTKAAILAAQAAELEAQKGRTPEEEAARQSELNRIAAEDDKRRRNTAASARFRVKKKQREHALEDTVRELNVKLEKMEKDLESTKVENSFLRDLVIRKVGLSDLPVPNNGGASGKLSGGQVGSTGMGTF